MRVPIPHDLPKEEVRRRLHEGSHEIEDLFPGGMAQVSTAWPEEDRMSLGVQAMGKGIDGQVLIEEGQVVFEIALPAALSFVEPMVAGAIRDKGQKLLGNK